MRLKRSCMRQLAVLLLILTAVILIAVPSGALEIYIPDTLEIPDPETANPSEITESEASTLPAGENIDPSEATETKKEKETVPTPVNYKKELITPAAILLLLAMIVFAVSCFIKYHKKI